MNSELGLGVFISLLAVFAQTQGTFPDAMKAKYESYLQQFDNQRGHVINSPSLDESRKNATDFIKSKFDAAGLTTHLQHFTSYQTNTGTAVNGTNVIGVLPGKAYKTAEDQVVILAAHLDTSGIQAGGVNNDGSGLVALISIAEELAGSENCTRNHSIIFAAFDWSETVPFGQGMRHCNKSCGSIAFIDSISTFIGSGSVQLAIVMDCIANFVTSYNNAQEFPTALQTYFKTEVQLNLLAYGWGDFVAFTGREDEKRYLEDYEKRFKAVRLENRFNVMKFQWNFRGVPSAINRTNLIDAFKDGDHMSFWDANLKAILLTDTCYNRGYMKNCKSNANCDTYSKLDAEDLQFMYSIAYSAMKMVKALTCTGACASCDPNASCQNQVCICKSGFSGTGKQCSDINECLSSNKCDKNADCINMKGGYRCLCKAGYKGDGVKCSVSAAASLVTVISHLLFFVVAAMLSHFWF